MRFKLSAIFFVLAIMVAAFPVYALPPDCTPGRPLIQIPQITGDEAHHRLRATLILSDDNRSLAGARTGTPCNLQHVRMFSGFATGQEKPWPDTGDILPGPVLRAHVGDWIEITFMNHVNPKNFPNTLDQDETGNTAGCDISTAQRKNKPQQTVEIYPRHAGPDQPWATPPWGGSPGDTWPNCLHGSSTANIHYHGTHTTPSTTGDNVLLYVRPALRDTGELEPKDSFVNEEFGKYFEWCEAHGPAQYWTEMPADWQTRQKELLMHYDSTAPYKGVPGKLPEAMKLWPRNDANLNHKPKPLWPEYNVGAFPYCFKLPAWKDVAKPDNKPALMGQAPGTHWYHAHKHGSTALNVGNGMTGILIIEGDYDKTLEKFYESTPQHKNWGLEQQVLMIQQLETALNLLGPTTQGGPPPLSVNGRLNPVVAMKPNQVQMWRVVNGAARTFVQFDSFKPQSGTANVAWRQIAQDGVQFVFENYQRFGKENWKFNLAPANRADLLVKAPSQEGDYALQIVQSVSDVPSGSPITLLTVHVAKDDKPIDPPMDFIKEKKDFPVFPPFLADIYDPHIYHRPQLLFNTNPSSARDQKGYLPRHEINGKLFQGQPPRIDQCMTLNTAEEWTLANDTVNIAHPFHIHINPFQITDVFQPNAPQATDPNNKCFADPNNQKTWGACSAIAPPWVWWDTFSIPTGRVDTAVCSGSPAACPFTNGSACAPNTQVCTVGYSTGSKTRTLACNQNAQTQKWSCPVPSGAKVVNDCSAQTACTSSTIPGHFKMRSRFVDFTGEYVLHCHILAHEDRGMMELVAVEEPGACKPNMVSPYSHH
ncbi:MAG TPA: multicopper oxidase domain-containing protein [Candidatus Angelobacter sp.]